MTMTAPLDYGAPLALSAARPLMAAAEAAAAREGWRMVVAIVDAGGHPVMLHRGDQAQHGSVEAALAKARSAVAFKRPTAAFDAALADPQMAVRLAAIPGLIPVAGGVPILRGGAVVGAIGVSGGTPSQDAQVAEAALG